MPKWIIFEGIFTGEADYTEMTSQGVPSYTFELIPDEGNDWRELGKSVDNAIILTWSRTAEICYDMLEVGSIVRVKGRIDTIKNHTAHIVAQEVSLF